MMISVPERGSTIVSDVDWIALAGNKQFWKLISAKIFKVEHQSGRWCLQGQCYVGRAVVGDHLVKATEKVVGSFEALVRQLSFGDAKVLSAPAPVSSDDQTSSLLVSLFIDSVRRYLSRGKRVAYRQIQERGALVSGRLDVVGTARLRARGLRHQASFFRTTLSADLPSNQAIYAALMQVDRLARDLPILEADVAAARVLRVAMSECRQGAISRAAAMSEIAYEESAILSEGTAQGDALSLAAVVLDSAGFGSEDTWSQTARRSWFVNLENLFERAVRKACVIALPDLNVTAAIVRPSLFDSVIDRYRANPDVIFRAGSEVVAVADAKYKALNGWPSHSDVFEILAHAAAYGAPVGLMVYPTEGSSQLRSFGQAKTKCELWILETPLTEIRTAVADALKKISVSPTT